jgi:hypothetical protein
LDLGHGKPSLRATVQRKPVVSVQRRTTGLSIGVQLSILEAFSISRVEEQKVDGRGQEVGFGRPRLLNCDPGDLVLCAKDLVQHAPHQVDVLVANLNEE